jgi:peptidoglycan/xylan/chitin deacetylase (PgdA/CDA1 family)
VSIALVLTYHAVEQGGTPLCIEPELFAEHLDCIVESGWRALTMRQLAQTLRMGALDSPSVVITFDDGFASVVESAAPLVVERGLPATVFCVAGYLGGTSRWPSSRRGGFQAPLASAAQLVTLAEAGIEIGCHGFSHAPLVGDSESELQRELVESKVILEQQTCAPVTSFAYPYGAGPSPAARELTARTYDAACTTRLGLVGAETDVYALPRVDAHYLRNPELLRRALAGSLGPYLGARRLAARARRVLVKDYMLRHSA